MGYQHIKGAIVIDLVCNYGVVLVAEKRVNWGLVGHEPIRAHVLALREKYNT